MYSNVRVILRISEPIEAEIERVPIKIAKVASASTETTVIKAGVICATRKPATRKSARAAESRTAGESAKCVTTTESVTAAPTTTAPCARPISGQIAN
jgi:hypothetical protein